MPPALRRLTIASPTQRRYDFSYAEEGVLAVVFIATVLVTRGLYDSISFLLALAIAALTAYAAVVAWRLIFQQNCSFRGTSLKIGGTLTRWGRFAAVMVSTLGILIANSAVVRFYEASSEAAVVRLADFEARGVDPALRQAEVALALGNLLEARRWAPVTPAGWRRQTASLYLREGKTNEVRREANAVLAADPGDLAARLLVAQSWLADGRYDLARQQAVELAESIHQSYGSRPAPLSRRQILAASHFLIGDIAGRGGNRVEARRHFEIAVASYSRHADAQLALGSLYAEVGRWKDAKAAYNAVLKTRPGDQTAQQAIARLPL